MPRKRKSGALSLTGKFTVGSLPFFKKKVSLLLHNRNISNRFVSDYDVELHGVGGKVPNNTEDHRIKHIQQWTVGKRNGPD